MVKVLFLCAVVPKLFMRSDLTMVFISGYTKFDQDEATDRVIKIRTQKIREVL